MITDISQKQAYKLAGWAYLLVFQILKSDFIPKILGVLLAIASIGYTIDSFGNFVSAAYASNEMVFMLFVGIPAITSEFSLTVWLLYKGYKK